MSPRLLEIVKEDEEDYLEIEIYKDKDFWIGLGVPTISLLFSLISFIITITIEDDFFIISLGSLCCLWPLSGLGMVLYGKYIENEFYERGGWVSTIFSFIIVILLVLLFYLILRDFGSW
tara:strand:- start:377 stop:733 length:357 start_codon:yes stop_codon:yes gene_type:complete